MAGSNGRVTVPQRMLNLLADGRPHTAQELHGCLDDELGPVSNIEFHISILRRSLYPRGEDITCRRREGVTWYAHVRSIIIN